MLCPRSPSYALSSRRDLVLSFLLKLRTQRANAVPPVSDAHTMLIWSVIAGISGAFATILFREGTDIPIQRLFSGSSGSFVGWPPALAGARIWMPGRGRVPGRLRAAGRAARQRETGGRC